MIDNINKLDIHNYYFLFILVLFSIKVNIKNETKESQLIKILIYLLLFFINNKLYLMNEKVGLIFHFYLLLCMIVRFSNDIDFKFLF